MPTNAESQVQVAARPTLAVNVVMRREPVTGPMSRWQPWRWVLADVLPEGAPFESHGSVAAQIARPAQAVQPLVGATAVDGASYWLYEGLQVILYRDDLEGYFLNLESPQPCFWVFWRQEEELASDTVPMAVPQIVTLSYHDAGRWLDAQEKVDQVPAPAAVVEWLRTYVDTHYQPEPKRRRRPDSFKPLTDRFGQPVRVSTDKLHRGGSNREGA